MKYSISNLAWGDTPVSEVIPELGIIGFKAVEIAPTAVWPDLVNLKQEEILNFKNYLEDHNLSVSGIQSLLYGNPNLQLFNQNCWGDMRQHLENVFRIGGLLGANVAVFGSPKNRVKGALDDRQADDMATSFLEQLIPSLEEHNLILTLEPNAPGYGADYLLTYEDVLRLSYRINSPRIRPQIDTGCLIMMGASLEDSYLLDQPQHIHLSTPNLGEVPGAYQLGSFFDLLLRSDYKDWIVIEMLANLKNPLNQIKITAEWLENYGSKHSSD